MSNSPQPPEDSVTFFLDRTHQSRDTTKFLRALGLKIELHKNNFDHDSPDPEWIPVCAAKGWIILTGDKGIESNGVNRDAVVKCAAKIFLINDHRTRGLEQTAALVAARKKIIHIALRNVGPFYCSVEMAKDDHVGAPRFQPGGYALEAETAPILSVSTSESQNNPDAVPAIPKKSEYLPFP